MGEVYRADDLKLGVTVALKFLPRELREDPTRHERFLGEVRLARQISHPNVCRVFDIGEAQGQHFFSMEYIDGEDLSSLLRRIGRLPSEKAAQIARQLCAGLAAAHELGILHRDLKPGNVMLDGRGLARITDFGLAALADEVEGAEIRAGTPAYMAPEQLAGETVSTKSDLYSLGLVLYELFTGRTAFEAASTREILDRQRSSTPSRPSSHVDDIDPAAERAILQCLESEPGSRPASALAVAAALPGGDPLAAAMAAGETPSPELVAQAGGEGALSRPLAWLALLGIVLGLGLSLWASERTHLLNRIAVPKSPQGLEERAREMVRTLGYTETPGDSTYGLFTDPDYIQRQLRSQDRQPDIELAEERGPVLFWYRQSPGSLTAMSSNFLGSSPRDDPHPRSESGMIRLYLTLDGRLTSFLAVPDSTETEDAPLGEPDVEKLFELAGLDPQRFSESRPRRVPGLFGDRRLAWEETATGSAPPRRVEASFWRGRLVTFWSTSPWTQPSSEPAASSDLPQRLVIAFLALLIGVFVLVPLAAALLAHRNLRAGRGDRRGAGKIAAVVGGLSLLGWILGVHHAIGFEDLLALSGEVGLALLWAAIAWVGYLAVEPNFRRYWPRQLVSWSRLLEGRFGDPLVSRHVLIGLLAGLLFYLIFHFLIGDLPIVEIPISGFVRLSGLGTSITGALGLVSLLAVSHFLLRRRRLSVVVFATLYFGYMMIALTILAGPLAALGIAILNTVLVLGVLLRVGLLPFVVMGIVGESLINFPLTVDRSLWFFPHSMATLGVLLAVTLWAFYHSLGGRPVFGDETAN